MNQEQNPNNLRVINREIVSGLIFSRDNKLLMGKKDPAKGGVYADCWHIPGGGVEDGEDKLATLRREILEETNIDVADAQIELIDDIGRGATEKILKETAEKVWCRMNFNVYKVSLVLNSTDTLLKPSDDLVILQWFSLNEVADIQLTPPSVELFKRLGYL